MYSCGDELIARLFLDMHTNLFVGINFLAFSLKSFHMAIVGSCLLHVGWGGVGEGEKLVYVLWV